MESSHSPPMPTPSNVSGSSSNSLMGQSVQCLAQQDFLGCRNYALQAQESDPNVPGAGQVLAIADLLHVAEHRRLKNNRVDYYAILQLSRAESANSQLVWTQFSKLVTLVNPKTNKYPFAMEAFNLLREAWALLSDREKKTQYDIEVGDEPEVAGEGGESSNETGFGEYSETFWTLCPYCYCMFEYGKVYEDFCLRCQTCGKGFHGVAISPPSPEIMVPGKDQYYLGYGVFPLGYLDEKDKVNENEGKKCLDSDIVDISDDDDDYDSLDDCSRSVKQSKSNDSSSVDAKNGNGDFVGGFWEKKVRNGEIGKRESRIGGKWPKKIAKVPARRMKNVKSVALNTKKIMGNLMRNRRSESVDDDDDDDDDIAMVVGAGLKVNVDKGKGIMHEGEDGNESAGQEDGGHGNVVFFDGQDDVFVGLADIPI